MVATASEQLTFHPIEKSGATIILETSAIMIFARAIQQNLPNILESTPIGEVEIALNPEAVEQLAVAMMAQIEPPTARLTPRVTRLTPQEMQARRERITREKKVEEIITKARFRLIMIDLLKQLIESFQLDLVIEILDELAGPDFATEISNHDLQNIAYRVEGYANTTSLSRGKISSIEIAMRNFIRRIRPSHESQEETNPE